MVVGQPLSSAISSDQSLVGISPPSTSDRITVQVYKLTASSCQLQLTLSHTSTDPLKDLVFCGNSSVLARFGTSQVVVWDLDRGVVSQKVDARDEEIFLGLSTCKELDDKYCILTSYSDKLLVQEYDVSKGKLLRKIKSGRWEGNSPGSDGDSEAPCALCVSPSTLVVQTGPGSLRILDSETGKKMGKIKATKGAGAYFTNLLIADGKLVATKNTGGASVYDIESCSESLSVPQPSISSVAAPTKNLSLNNDVLLMNESIITLNGSKAETVSVCKSVHAFCMFLINNKKVVALIYQKRSGCQARWLSLEDDLEESTDLDATPETTETPDSSKDASSSKRKTADPMILGPRQAGAEPAPRPKKSKAGTEDMEVDDEQEDVTIADRLKQLTEAMAEEDEDGDDETDGATILSKPFKPKQATTESLKELLSQALQASEDSLLELALNVRDVKVITNTLKELEPAMITTLLAKLTNRLASNPLRAESMTKWIQYCLRYGTFQKHQLAPLQNLIHERIESFSDLLRLEGRLSLMCDVE